MTSRFPTWTRLNGLITLPRFRKGCQINIAIEVFPQIQEEIDTGKAPSMEGSS